MYDDLVPDYLLKSIEEFEYVDSFDGDPTQKIRFRGEDDWSLMTARECVYYELYDDINCAEVAQEIPPDLAWELREKYLDLERG